MSPSRAKDKCLPMWETRIPSLVGKISQAEEQLSPCATATEPTHSRARARQQEKPLQLESSPSSPQLEKKPTESTQLSQEKDSTFQCRGHGFDL